MKILITLLFFAAGAMAQIPNRVRFVTSNPSGTCSASYITQNTSTGALYGCVGGTWTSVGGGGGGSGTVTSVGLAGTASQITVTGSTPITGSGSWTLSLPASLLFPGSARVTSALLTNAEYDNGTCTTAATIDPANGNRQKMTLTNAQACALTFTQPASGTVSIQLRIIQSAAGSFNGTITGGLWSGGTVPTITATSGAVDIITCSLNGTSAYCAATQDFR